VGSLAIALGATSVLVVVTLVVEPAYWSDFVASILSNVREPQYYSLPPPAPVRIPIAIVLVIWGARTDRPWTVPIAATLGLPILWPHGLCVALAAIPFVRRGDRAALTAGWERAADPRLLALTAGIVVGGALLVALIAPDSIQSVMNWASSNFQP